MDRLVPVTTALVVVDVQERLAKAMDPAALERLLRAARILIEAARRLGAPVAFTEQYPKGLGPTLPELEGWLTQAGARRFEKTSFSACGASGFADVVGPPLVAAVVLGMETHVCVYQTVRDLRARGLTVHVPIDGVASRRDDHREAGLALVERAGGIRTTSETVVFDWLADSAAPEFKALSALIR